MAELVDALASGASIIATWRFESSLVYQRRLIISKDKKKKILVLLSVIILIIIFFIVTSLLWNPIVEFFSKPEIFRKFVKQNAIQAGGILAFAYSLQIIFAFLPGEPIELGAGYAFGPIVGSILCLIGDIIGTLIVVFIVRKFGKNAAEILIGKNKLESINFIKNNENLNLIVFLLFFIPGTPKDVLTYFIGLTDMPITNFIIVSAAGRVPAIFLSTIAGDAISSKKYFVAIIIYAVAITACAVGVIVYKKFLVRIKSKKDKNK